MPAIKINVMLSVYRILASRSSHDIKIYHIFILIYAFYKDFFKNVFVISSMSNLLEVLYQTLNHATKCFFQHSNYLFDNFSLIYVLFGFKRFPYL